MSYAVLNQLRRGKPLAASVPSKSPDRLAWIGVYPLDMASDHSRRFLENHRQPIPLPNVLTCHIRHFEVDRGLVEQDVWLSERDLQNSTSYFTFGDEDLVKALKRLGVEIEQLEPHWKTDYPI
ncbi:hypothetical protein LQG66_03515 [Bradyrhizobium ontarionense]|uniref:Uncharacterized protein n=1 Tax=Bradyrhizobium ontarionense TaxID=2898149 RepID=A0ABY3RMC2_9BRAD|nr:hypothetical protein [Bradyrhizobium sp. A19]UFZ08660.1 hypothetical protein LQG66_03515 [Bradyrhizobium sp. A19]